MSTPSISSPRADSPVVDMDTRFWPEAERVWIDLTFETNDAPKSFVEFSLNSFREQILILPLLSENDRRSCLRISCPTASTEAIFTILFDAFPGLGEFMLSKNRFC